MTNHINVKIEKHKKDIQEYEQVKRGLESVIYTPLSLIAKYEQLMMDFRLLIQKIKLSDIKTFALLNYKLSIFLGYKSTGITEEKVSDMEIFYNAINQLK